MAKEIIDKRVLRILRWSLVVQIIFLIQSSISPGFYNFLKGIRPEVSWVSFIPVSGVVLILILLSFKKIQKKITKPVFLIILYMLALMTFLSRNFATAGDLRGLNKMAPFVNVFRGGWEIIFFLIIPLVFIAWQYSMREVVFFCFSIVLVEAIPFAFPREERDIFFYIVNFMSGIARSLTMLIVGWIENQLVKVQREQHAQLMEANKKLRKYALTSEKLAQTQERNRLARELHDTLAHTLSSVSVQLEAIKALFDRNPGGAKKMLDETLANTKNGLTETRRTLVDLRSSELESYGLTQAIRNLGKSTAERGGFKISYKLDKSMDVLSDDISHCLYRTAQEALENTLRHASAKHVSISLLAEVDGVRLQVKDDGQGFDINGVDKENLGILGMRERVEMLGGSFMIESSLEGGTTVTAVMENAND